MPIESYLTEEDLNIKDLSLEQPRDESGLEFDVNREITKEDWQKMKEYLETATKDKLQSNFLKVASAMLLLFPERKSELGLTEEKWQKCVKLVAKELQEHLSIRTMLLAQLKQLYPEKFLEMPPELAEELTWTPALPLEVSKMVDEGMKDFSPLHLAAEAKTTFPEIDFGRNFSRVHIKQLAQMIEREKELRRTAIKGNPIQPKATWGGIVAHIAKFRILFPEYVDDVAITKADLKGIKKSMAEDRRRNDYAYLAIVASNLKMALAEKVVPTDNGLVIVDRKEPKLNELAGPLPQTKKF